MEQINEYIVDVENNTNGLVFIGNDKSSHKTVLINSADKASPVKLKTDNLVLKTSVEMEQKDGAKLGCFHVIQCVSSDVTINNQFARICSYAFSNIIKPMSTAFAVENFQNLQLLFETSAERETHKLQIGIYGELVFLNYLVEHGMGEVAQKWHSNFYLKHDMELDEKKRIEIKTTNKERRVHTFKHNQLVQKNIDVYVGSVMIEETETGYSLYDLMLETAEMFENPKQKMEIEKLIRICNLNDENKGITCDRQHVFENIRIYKAEYIPHLREDIPDGITGIQYDVSLENCDSCNIQDIL